MLTLPSLFARRFPRPSTRAEQLSTDAFEAEQALREKQALKRRVPVAAVDLDGTICKPGPFLGPEHFHPVRPGVKKGLERFQQLGYHVLIHTCRGNVDSVKKFLHDNDLPFDYVNAHPNQPDGTSSKPVADVYVDDRAINAAMPWERITRQVVHRLGRVKASGDLHADLVQRKRDGVQDAVNAQTADDLVGIEIFLHADTPFIVVIDVMDWGDDAAGQKLGKAVAKIVGKDHVIYHNEQQPPPRCKPWEHIRHEELGGKKSAGSVTSTHPYIHLVAQAGKRVHQEPSKSQIEAGNYRKGHVHIHGLDVSIETPAGGIRRGYGRDGKQWAKKLPCAYGYLKRTEGADGENVDVYIGAHPHSELVFIVDQVHPHNETFDEQKVVLGCLTEQEARDLYLSCCTSGWKGLGAITAVTMKQFKRWLAKGDMRRPVSLGRRPSLGVVA